MHAPGGLPSIFPNVNAFVAVKDGLIAAYGDAEYGGGDTCRLREVDKIYSNGNAFVAIREDGGIAGAWGYAGRGGNLPQSRDSFESVRVRGDP